jgi:tetratricopeptide (TPR) repeat protein
MMRNGGAAMPIRRPLGLAALAAVGLTQGCTLFGPPVVPISAREHRANQSLYASRRIDETRLQAAIEDDPTDVSALLQLAEQYRRRGETDAAKKLVAEARKIAPESSLVRVRHAELLADAGSTLAARWEIEQVLSKEKFGEAYALKGRLLWERGKKPEAIDAWMKAWRAQPPSVDAGVALARWDLQQEDWAAAAEKLRLAAAMRPDDAAIRRYFAQALAGGGDAADAADQLERAVALGDDKGERYFHLAALHQRSGDHKAAEEYYLRGKQMAPNSPLRGDVEELLERVPERSATRSPYRPLGIDPPK